jgi:hypothetical protein
MMVTLRDGPIPSRQQRQGWTMLLLLDQGGGRLSVRRAGLRKRLAVRVLASRLDRDIAAGNSPDSTAELALRAHMLVRMSLRRDLARSMQRIVEASTPTGPSRRLSIPVCRDRVAGAMTELQTLVEHLVRPGPVCARGVAQVSALLSDGSGPLYDRGNTEDLPFKVLEMVDALNPLSQLDGGIVR